MHPALIKALQNPPLAAGIACGALVGYSSTNLLDSACLATACGAVRAISTLLFDYPRSDRHIANMIAFANTRDPQRAQEIKILEKECQVAKRMYSANLGFCIGMTLGTCVAAPSLLSGIVRGFCMHSAGILSECLPVGWIKSRTVYEMRIEEGRLCCRKDGVPLSSV